MFGLPPGSIEWLAVGGLLTALGALIRFGGLTFLIAGYDETSSVPEDVAADVTGGTLLRLGGALVAVGVLAAVWTLPEYVGVLVGAAVVVAVGRMVYRLNAGRPGGAEA